MLSIYRCDLIHLSATMHQEAQETSLFKHIIKEMLKTPDFFQNLIKSIRAIVKKIMKIKRCECVLNFVGEQCFNNYSNNKPTKII